MKHSAAWLGLSQIITMILQFAASIVTAHYLSPADMGVYASGAAIVGVVSLIQTVSLPAIIIRERELDDALLQTTFTTNLVIALALSATIAAIGLAAPRLVGDQGVGSVVLTLSLMPLIGVVSMIPGSVLEREARFRELAIVGTVSSTLTASLTVLYAVGGFRYMSIVYASLVSNSIGAALLVIAYKRLPFTRLSFRRWRDVGDFGLQLAAVSGLTSLNQRTSDLMLARFQGLTALGLYNRAANITGLVWNSVHAVAGRVILVDFAQFLRRDESLRTRYLEVSSLMTSLMWPAFCGLAVLSPEVIRTLYGQKWLFAANALSLIAVSSAIQVSATMTWELFTAKGELARQTKLEGVRFVVSVSIFALGCAISLEAAAAARIFDAVFAVAIYWRHLLRMTDTASSDYKTPYAHGLFLTAAAITPAVILRVSTTASSVLLLTLVIAAGVGLWAVTALYLDLPIARRAKEAIPSMKIKRLSLRHR